MGFIYICFGLCLMFRPVDWEVFVRDLSRQLGTPSHWLPVDSCKKRTKGRPSGRLHSDAQVSQQETPNCAPPYLSTACGTLKVVKRTVYRVYILALANNLFSSPLCVASRLRASNWSVFWEICQNFEPRSQNSQRYLNYPRI